MTNSSPQPPENESRRRPILDRDEKIAVIVAFLTIGSILFWTLGSGLRQGILSTSGLKSSWSKWTNSLLSSDRTTDIADIGLSETKATTDIDSTRASTDHLLLNGKLSEPVESETLERTSKYLDRQSKIKDDDDLTGAAAFTKPTGDLDLAAPAATGIALGTGMAKPNVTQPRTPKLDGQATAPKVAPLPTSREKVTTPEVAPTTPKTEGEVTPPTPQIAFRDIQPDYWAYPFIARLGERQLISGSSGNNSFEPEKLITRGSMATLLSEAFDLTISQPARNFTDVSNQDALADIKKAVETGFMKGYSDREFRPRQNIPRYQVLVTLASGLDLPPSQDASTTLSKFDDTANIPDWAREQVAAAIEAGLVVNRPAFSTNSLNPDEPATRAEVAAMIHQALVRSDKLQPIDSQYIVRP
jgi:hypothetical protein